MKAARPNTLEACQPLLWVLLCSALACGGKSLDLDQQQAATPAPPSPTGAVVETGILPEHLQDFWVDDTRLFWENYDSVLRSCVFENCNQTPVTYGAMDGEAVVVGSERVFWPTGPYLPTVMVSCPVTGCVGQPQPFARDEYLFWPTVTGDAAYLYWASTFDIYRCPFLDCGEIPEVVSKSDTANVALKLHDDYAYWISCPGMLVCQDAGSAEIHRAPKDGSKPPTTVVPKGNIGLSVSGWDFAVDGTRVLWIDQDSHVRSCPVTGCQAEPDSVVATNTWKQELQADEAGVYWLEGDGQFSGPNSVEFCPSTGCSGDAGPLRLTSNEAAVFKLSATYVYWVSSEATADGYIGSRDVQRISKPKP